MDFHDAENRQRPCRMVVRPDDYPDKIKSWYRFASSELRWLPLGRKLDVKISCGDWCPPIGRRTKESCRGRRNSVHN
ncbi:hypothetical protein TNCV_103291 [Trichonephila clavipes]|nr:hypothetical protein TNCV_103291 [Trichonephila clavipes]